MLSIVIKLLILFSMPFTIEPVFLEKILVRVCMMIASAVKTFEEVGVWFTLLSFQPRRVGLTVCFTTLSKVLIVFGFVGTITLDTFGSLAPT